MWLLWLLIATATGSLSEADVILVNNTGLEMARIEIDKNRYEEVKPYEKLLIEVTPTRHDLHVVFKGGADIDWPHFDFKGVHEIFFEREHNKIQARVQ